VSVDPRYRVCLVTDRGLARGRSSIDIALAAVAGGATMVQLREKDLATCAFIEEARALRERLAPLGVPLVINDRADVALAVGADGLHVGQDDMPYAMARALLPGKIIGLSITALDQLDAADARAADYLGVGPIFAQATKADAAPPLGLEGLRAARRLTNRPLMAIGGVTAANAAALRAAGADGLAIVSAIVAANDPQAATQEIAAAFG
jgi:thiamine-phosphate pyrophosphorylase